MKTWLGSMKPEQVDELEEVFATLTEDGWVIPEWLQVLRQNVMAKRLSNLSVPQRPRE